MVPGAEGLILSGKRTGEGTPVVRPDVFICFKTKFNYLSLFFYTIRISATRASPKGLEFLRTVTSIMREIPTRLRQELDAIQVSLAYQGQGCAFKGGVFRI